jgi:antimicrobial peptide system SdpB family protein
VRSLTAAVVQMVTHPRGGCDPRGRAIAVGRSLIALAQLSVLLFTPDDILLVDRGALRCDGIHAVTLWCVTGTGPEGLTASRFLGIAILGLVASGLSPRWTCVPHWYVTFSITSVIVPLNGGDKVALIAAMLSVPLFLGDSRRWHWTSPSKPMALRWHGVSHAVLATLRIQLAIIYVVAVVSKLLDRSWLDGNAFRIIMTSPSFGPDSRVLSALRPILDVHWMGWVFTWSVIAIQILIVVLIFAGPRGRVVACVLGIVFHVGIVVVLRLPSFGIEMIGLLIMASADCRPAGTGRIHGVSSECTEPIALIPQHRRRLSK